MELSKSLNNVMTANTTATWFRTHAELTVELTDVVMVWLMLVKNVTDKLTAPVHVKSTEERCQHQGPSPQCACRPTYSTLSGSQPPAPELAL